ncbi:MAG: acyl--CoA ligase [Firmicutes bacterium]|nr:acyl--CoA ligase [Bacillota bacterium]
MKFLPSVIENIFRHAAENPDKLCLADLNQALNYGQMRDACAGLSIELSSRGVTKGSYVIIECNQSVDYLVSILSVQLAGAIPVPVEQNAAVSRILELAGETDPVLFVSYRYPDELQHIPYLDIKEACTYASAADVNVFPVSDDVAEVLFSTGTTGKSKGIVLTHSNDIAIAENVCFGVEQKPDNVEMIPMPTSHSHGLRRTYANLCNGSSVVFIDGVMYLKRLFKLMDQYHVTAMDLSPSMLSIIFKLSGDRLGDYADVLDYIQLGSAPLAEEDKQHLSKILPKTRLYNFYGSTEAGCSCLLDFNKMSGKPGCIGRPAVNSHFIVVDENKNEIESSPDKIGFLASSGAINMREYYHAPKLTAETMQNGFIYTKDVGYIDEEGLVYMLGRKDDVINYGGIKISPEEIEAIVIQHPAIEDCALIPMEDPLTGQAPKLFIQLSETEEYDPKEFRSWLAKNIDQNKQPVRIETIAKIPRTFNGKIIRHELKECS